jgi:hypothetical protein
VPREKKRRRELPELLKPAPVGERYLPASLETDALRNARKDLLGIVRRNTGATPEQREEAVRQFIQALGFARAGRILLTARPDISLGDQTRAVNAMAARLVELRSAIEDPTIAHWQELLGHTKKTGPINTVRRALYDLDCFAAAARAEIDRAAPGGRRAATIEFEFALRVVEILKPFGALVSRSEKSVLMRCLAILFPLCGATSSPSSVVQKIQRAAAAREKPIA